MTATIKTAPVLQNQDGQERESVRLSSHTSSRSQRITSGKETQPQPEHYEAVKASITVPDVARLYGLEADRHGKALCPFHSDHHPSMQLYPERFKCFSCGASGTVIDLAAQLLGLSPADTVRRLNLDFGLNLPLNREETPEERAEAKKRREVRDTKQQYESWRNELLTQLCAAIRTGNDALKKPMDCWTLEETLAVREQARLEWRLEQLETDSMDEQIEVFRERRGVVKLCNRILSSTPTK